MALLILALLIAGFVCFAVEAWRSRSLIAAGLALWILTAVIAAWPAGLGHG
jgi:uncharacterized protein YqgC (DUF456 family)